MNIFLVLFELVIACIPVPDTCVWCPVGIIMAEWQLFTVAGYLVEERRRWPILLPHEDNVLNKFRILQSDSD